MSFDVTTADLRAARNTLQRLARDTDRADSYKSDYLKIGTGDAGAFFQHVDNVNSQVVSQLDTLLRDLRRLLHDGGDELAAVARMYDETDRAAVARSDARLAEVEAVPPDETFDRRPDVPDTVPEDPGDYTPPEDHDVPLGDEDGVIMAPGPLGQPSTGTGGYTA